MTNPLREQVIHLFSDEGLINGVFTSKEREVVADAILALWASREDALVQRAHYAVAERDRLKEEAGPLKHAVQDSKAREAALTRALLKPEQLEQLADYLLIHGDIENNSVWMTAQILRNKSEATHAALAPVNEGNSAPGDEWGSKPLREVLHTAGETVACWLEGNLDGDFSAYIDRLADALTAYAKYRFGIDRPLPSPPTSSGTPLASVKEGK